MARRTAALVVLIILQTGVQSATTLARRRLGEDLDTLVPLSVDAKAQELQQLQQWVTETPHAPGAELAEALEAAAWRPATNLSRGFVILNSGSKYAFDELLPRWLASMSPTLDDDIAQHTVIVTLGASAHELCQGMQQHYRHQCVLLPHWTGPDRMYHFADDWYTAVTLSKLELLYNVVSLGYDAVWMDTDIVHIRNPLPFLANMEVDVAVTSEHCVDSAPALLADVLSGRLGKDLFVFNTGITYLAASAATVRFARDWFSTQRTKQLEAFASGFESIDLFERPHDQRTFHLHMLPQLQQDYQANSSSGPYLRMGVLNQTQFPNRCGGWCGCDGATPRGPSQLMAHNDSHAHFLSGRIQCPAEVWDSWIAFHMPCVKTFHEKVGLIDAYQSALVGLLRTTRNATSLDALSVPSKLTPDVSTHPTVPTNGHKELRLRHRQQ